ncbi:MAG TPA: transglutaminase family protein [Burkholderiales bacterium]|jgi:transglutaminase-like putative cysteine protease|nr:transglutaminase family protein [Burkholderiales bacterium]
MKLSVVHETHYRYSSPVPLSHQLLHLTPRELPWQQPVSHRLTVDPQPAESEERDDYFGNRTVRLLLATPHDELLVRAESEVIVQPRSQAGSVGGEPAEFLYESPHVETWRELTDYAAKSAPQGRPPLEAATDLMRRIHRDFKFDRTATSVSTPLKQVMKQRSGVCQDFAHLMAGGLRALGIPARYVSGYILTSPPPGRPRLVGADASHAWVSVFSGEWIDLDPTNNRVVDDEYVTLAWGRDFDDVTPMRGVILGGGEQQLAVRVTVTPLA